MRTPGIALSLVGLILAPAPASAAAPAAGPMREITVSAGPIAGTVVLDQQLRDYRWDTQAHALLGAAGRAEFGPLGAGVRIWRTQTTQATGIPGSEIRPDVALTGTDLLGEARLLSVAGVRLLASGSVGLLHIGYSPDTLLVDDGSGSTIRIDYDPISEWTAGVGVGVRRSLVGGLEASVGVDRSWFRLDTTHRAGDEIVRERETFGNWTARVEITHRILQI